MSLSIPSAANAKSRPSIVAPEAIPVSMAFSTGGNFLDSALKAVYSQSLRIQSGHIQLLYRPPRWTKSLSNPSHLQFGQ